MSGGQINVTKDAAGAVPIVTTQPDRILRHNISDEELDMLCEGKSDLIKEMLFVAIGAGVGAAPAAMTGVWGYFFGTAPGAIEGDQLLQLVILFAGLAVAICMAVVGWRKSDRSTTLRDSIRARS